MIRAPYARTFCRRWFMELRDYVDAALARNPGWSLAQLSRVCGMTDTVMSTILRGRALPSDDLMIRLAREAGVSIHTALLDLQRWRAKTPEVKTAWEEISRRAGGAFAFLPLVPAEDHGIGTILVLFAVFVLSSVYYGKFAAWAAVAAVAC